ncbi:hypothetical protein HNY73_008126 [Argiope bruennichi]|uniref:Uncharacterized protein n=1 Tax=Argiope bruennichi TaxID=94029 RepID=A0A8T0F5C4_ARGBR|nr:hypothetical protein HNY73_008126 [Argiope bruennichi]
MERRNVSIHQGTALSLAADPYTSPSFTPAGPCRTYPPPSPSEQLMIFYWFVGDARFRVDAEGEGSQSFPLERGGGGSGSEASTNYEEQQTFARGCAWGGDKAKRLKSPLLI